MSFKYFLVSSQVHQEKNSLSEAASILSNFKEIEKFKAKLLPVGGLSLLESEESIVIPDTINEIIKKYLDSDKLFFCFKIIPLEFFDLLSDEALFSWINNNMQRIEPGKTWKVVINKRHNSINKQNIISQIANKVTNPVDLKNPDFTIQVEIIGKYLGLSILKSFQIIQLSSELSQMQTKDTEGEDDEEFAE